MNDDSIRSADVYGRSHVDSLVKYDPEGALKVARAINHPWYRCQSLSKVAEHWVEKEQRVQILKEALKTAQLQDDINRIVSVSAWPLRVLVKLDTAEVANQLKFLVTQAESELHTLRRADALFSVAAAVSTDRSLLSIVIPSLVRALLGGYGWRIDRLIRNSSPLVKIAMPELLAQLLEHHSECKKKKELLDSFA
jgi:hypothetical protein